MPNLTINNQTIPWSYYWRMVKKLGIHETDRVLFRARKANSVLTYIAKGLKKGWILQSTTYEDYNKQSVLDWISKTIPKPAQARQPKLKPQTKKGKKGEVESIKNLIGGYCENKNNEMSK